MKRPKSFIIAAAASVLLTFPASAHPGHGDAGDFAFGWLHPIGDLEQLFIMITIGLLVIGVIWRTGSGR